MKVLLVPYCYYPDAVGGTEIYVKSLAASLKRAGVIPLIAAPGNKSETYHHDEIPVFRYKFSENIQNVQDLYNEGDIEAEENFFNILSSEAPDIVHLHAMTRAVSLRLVRRAKKAGAKVLFTYHTPTVSCQKGTLMLWEKKVCDGEIRINRCSGCVLHGRGLPKWMAQTLGNLPPWFGNQIAKLNVSGKLWTALRMSELMEVRRNTFQSFMQEVHHIVAVCEWVQNVLRTNGVPSEKITLSRHGIIVNDETSPPPDRKNASPRKVVFIGRMHRTKGLHMLIDALRLDPSLPLNLDIYGIVQGAEGEKYAASMKEKAAGDPRIRFMPPIPHQSIIPTLQQYDFIAVPSQWIESGPLVVLEAFEAGIPVIGYDLGGIRDLVQHDKNGFLLPYDSSSQDWLEAMRRLSTNTDVLYRLKQGVPKPKRMQMVAEELIVLYSRLLNLPR